MGFLAHWGLRKRGLDEEWRIVSLDGEWRIGGLNKEKRIRDLDLRRGVEFVYYRIAM